MGLFAAWVSFPVLLAVMAYGVGALVQLASGRRLPLGVRLPCGLALIIAVMDLFTRTTATAHLAVAAVVTLAVVGLGVAVWTRVRAGGGPRWPRPPAGVFAALGVYALYAAPIVLSGAATWSGFFQLDDTANWLSVVTRALSAGRTRAGLPASAYDAVLFNYLVTGYPLGAFLPLGLGHAVLGEDVAWLTDPWMAFMAAMLVLALSYGARRALPRAPAWQPALIAGLAALSALLYGYYLWGGMKELADAFLIATFAVSLPLVLEEKARVRAAIPAVVALWGLVAAESPGGLVWVGPGTLVAFGLLTWHRRARSTAPTVAPAVAVDASPQATGAATPAEAAKPAAKPANASRGKREGSQAARVTPPARRASGAPASMASTRRRTGAGGQSRWSGGRRREPARWRALLDDARGRVADARGRAADGPGAGAWLAGLSTSSRRLAAAAIIIALGGLVLALRPGGWVNTFHAVLTAGGAVGVGDLHQPLNPVQVAGIWPNGDFRNAASPLGLTYVLIAVAVIGAIAGLVLCVRRRRTEVVLYLACTITGAAIVYVFASAWIGAKALAAASPAVPFAALIAAFMLLGRRRWLGVGLAVVVTGGILWSDALGYHDVWLAPRAQLAELIQVDRRIAGRGPTLVPDPEVFAVRYFLRDGAPESPGEVRSRTDPLINGQTLPTGGYADLDELSLGSVLQYPTIVLHKSPANSRPPYLYHLTYDGRYWQVWQRPSGARSAIVSYAPLGSVVAPGSVPVCRGLLALARSPGVRRLVAAPVTNPIVVGTATGTQPARWNDPAFGGHYSALAGPGTARFPVSVPTAGRYNVWLRGTSRPLTIVSIDGHRVGAVRDDIQRELQYIEFGTVTLSAGTHTVALQRPGGQLLDPGVGGHTDEVGPLELQPDVTPAPLVYVGRLRRERSAGARSTGSRHSGPDRPGAAGGAQPTRLPSSASTSGASSTTPRPGSTAPSTSTSEANGPTCRGGRLTTPTTSRPMSASRA